MKQQNRRNRWLILLSGMIFMLSGLFFAGVILQASLGMGSFSAVFAKVGWLGWVGIPFMIFSGMLFIRIGLQHSTRDTSRD